MGGRGGRGTGLTFDSCVHRSLSSSSISTSPNGFSTSFINPLLPTAFFTPWKPLCTTSFAPTTPATPPATLPSILKPPVTTRFPVVATWATCSTASSRG